MSKKKWGRGLRGDSNKEVRRSVLSGGWCPLAQWLTSGNVNLVSKAMHMNSQIKTFQMCEVFKHLVSTVNTNR